MRGFSLRETHGDGDHDSYGMLGGNHGDAHEVDADQDVGGGSGDDGADDDGVDNRW